MATIILAALDIVSRESLLFAAVGFLIGGLDDLAIDLVFFARRTVDWYWGRGRRALPGVIIPAPLRGRFALFVPAWDEQRVIGAMLRHLLAAFGAQDYRVYVGTYPNDRATIDAVAAVAADDARIRLVIGAHPGPTTKADCLNTLWRALERDRVADGVPIRAVVLHDAEDVVHPAELVVFDALIDDHAAVQLPVMPLPNAASRLVGGHYCDEFAEAHGKQLMVRQLVGAGLPLAGVGCAIAHEMLQCIAAARGAGPFDADSLTEDYELGLHVATLGGRGIIARVRSRPGSGIVCVRAYFPATTEAAVRQKARWMTGIALAGWDRIGWARWHQIGDHWMRMRDRRAPLAVVVLLAAYLALVSGAAATLAHLLAGVPPPPLSVARWLVLANAALLGWRLMMRALFTGLSYGAVEAAWSVPRIVVGNVIAIFAARRAVLLYIPLLRGSAPRWDKTAHIFPDLAGSTQP